MRSGRKVPPLHVVTDREVLERTDFLETARRVLAAGARGSLALHLRARGANGKLLLEWARALRRSSPEATLLVNDRVDVARIVGVGAHLPELGLSVAQARAILGKDALLGRSVHDPPWEGPGEGDLDYLIYGHVFETSSKAGIPPRGLAGLVRVVGEAQRLGLPVIAIGGVTPDRVAPILGAGAWGVAAISGIWSEPDPAAAARRFLTALAAVGRRPSS